MTYAIAHGNAAVQAARIIATVEADRQRATIATQQCGDKLARIRAVREEMQCGIQEAKRIVEREDLIDAIGAAQTIEDIKFILLRII